MWSYFIDYMDGSTWLFFNAVQNRREGGDAIIDSMELHYIGCRRNELSDAPVQMGLAWLPISTRETMVHV
jgi:hypothetical protein